MVGELLGTVSADASSVVDGICEAHRRKIRGRGGSNACLLASSRAIHNMEAVP